ncbi:MAG: AAA family ATPase [Actinomycetota bacterium]
MTTTHPLLVLVSGAPGAGKSTLARQLAPKLNLPLVAKDDIKESIADAIDSKRSLLWSKRFGAATIETIWALMERFAEAGASAIFESNFYPDHCTERLRSLVDRYALVTFEVHCMGDTETIRQRCASRDRHPIHHSNRPSLAAMKRWMHNNRAIELNEHVIRVDTTTSEPVDLGSIVARIREVACGL